MKMKHTKALAAMFMALALSTGGYAGNGYTTGGYTGSKAGKTVKIRMIETTDVHGRFFPYDFINQCPADGSLARVSAYVDSLRSIYGDRLLLMDAGDVLQGQPVVTYYNYVKTDAENIAASVNNFLTSSLFCATT